MNEWVVALLIGGGIGGVLGALLSTLFDDEIVVGFLIGAVLGAIIGIVCYFYLIIALFALIIFGVIFVCYRIFM